MVRGDDGGGIGLAVVTAQLGKDLVEADAHGEGEPQLPPHPRPDRVGDSSGVPAEEVHAAGDIQPALVDTEGLHQVGVLPVDVVHQPGELSIELMVGREEHQVRTLLPCLPNGFRSFDAKALGGFVFRQNDALPACRVAADGHRPFPQVRPGEELHRGVEAVEVTVQDGPVHSGGASFLYHTTQAVRRYTAAPLCYVNIKQRKVYFFSAGWLT